MVYNRPKCTYFGGILPDFYCKRPPAELIRVFYSSSFYYWSSLGLIYSKATMKKKPLIIPQYVFPLLSPNLGVLLALLIFDCEAVIGVIGISWSRRSSSSARSSSLFSSALIFVGNGVPLLLPIDRTVRGPGVAKSVFEHKLSFFWFNFHLPYNSQNP